VPESGEIRQTSPDYRDTVPDFDRSGQTPGIWPDPAILAESPASPAGSSQNGGIPASFRSTGQDPAVFCRIPAKMARFRQLCRNLYLPNIKKIFLYYFILTFFIL
jgi:hypothetical protein